MSDSGALDALIDKVLAEKQVTAVDLASSQGKAMGLSIGQVMQGSGGKANPKKIRELLQKKLGTSG